MGFHELDPRATAFLRKPGQPFGFKVYRPAADRYDEVDDPLSIPDDCWALGLPHQSDDWAIAMSPDREQVLAEACRFRDELDAAIRELQT